MVDSEEEQEAGEVLDDCGREEFWKVSGYVSFIEV